MPSSGIYVRGHYQPRRGAAREASPCRGVRRSQPQSDQPL